MSKQTSNEDDAYPERTALDRKGGHFGPFVVRRRLGSGGAGIVFEAIHHQTGMLVALKAVTVPSSWARASLRQEISVLRNLDHEGIVRILDDGLADGGVWYAMELLEGVSLADFNDALPPCEPRALVQEPLSDANGAPSRDASSRECASREGPSGEAASREAASREAGLSARLAEVLPIYARLATTLDFLHAKGIVHGDLKPENVLVRRGGHPVLVDFGLSRYAETVHARLDPAVLSVGTLCYAAPERLEGEHAEPRSDTYSLGAMLYESLAGAPPFHEREADGQRRRMGGDPLALAAIVPGCPAEVEEIIRRMLARARDERPHHIREVADVLGRFVPMRPARRENRSPLEATSPRLHRPRLAGRDDVLEEVETLHRVAQNGRGALAFLGGESGIGKTFVLSEIGRRASLRRARVVMGECLPVAVTRDGPTYQPSPLATFVDLLRAAADACLERPQAALAVLSEWCGVLAPFEPSFASFAASVPVSELADLPPAAARDRLFAALRACLVVLSQDRPLVLLLDDLHWADDLTLSFLLSLGRDFFESHGVLVLAAYRAEERSAELGRLVAAEGVVRLRLGQLRVDEIRSIVGDMLGDSSPPLDVVADILGVSEGNPYFAAEYLRALVAGGAMKRACGRWCSDEASRESGPRMATLEAVIERRLSFVSPDGRAVLGAAAVLGRTFDLAWLGAVVERSREQLEALLESAHEREILERTPNGYRFLHDKLRQVAYEATGSDRRALHEKAARTRESLPIGEGVVDERSTVIAYHYRAAGILDRAFVYLVRAGEAAMASFAYRESIALLKEALDLRGALGPCDPVEEARLRRLIADAFQGLGDLSASEAHLVVAAARLGLPIPSGNVRLVTAFLREVVVQIAHRLRLRAGTLRTPHDPRLEEAARVYDRLQQVNFYRGEGLPIFFCGVTTLNVAERIAPSAELATAYANAHAVAGVVPWAKLSESYLQKARSALDARPDAVVESYLMMLTGVYRIGLGQWGEAGQALGHALRLARTLGFRRRVEEVLGALGEQCFLRDDLDEAIRYSTEQFESGARGDAQTQCWGLLGRAQARIVGGAAESAKADLEQALVLAANLGRPEQIWAYGLAGLRALDAGNLDEAVQFADWASRKIAETPPVAHYCLGGYSAVTEIRLAALTHARHEQAGYELARRLAERACRAERAAARIFPVAFPSYAIHCGALLDSIGETRRARDAWQRALSRARALGMPRMVRLAERALAESSVARRESHGLRI